MVSLDIGVWAAALMTIGIYSLGFKYTRLYKFCEFTFVGLGTGYGIVLAWDNIQRIGIKSISMGKISFIIPIILGILLYARFIPKMQWIGRYPLAVITGIGTGVAVRGFVQANIVKQIIASAKPLWGAGAPLTYINNLIIIVLTISGLIFFVFTIPIEKSKGGNLIGRIGRMGLMIGFGALFANTVLSRYSFLIGRVQFLLFDFLGL